MYLIVNTVTKRAYKKPSHLGAEQYETERGAKTACTKLNKKTISVGLTVKCPWEVMTPEQFRKAYPVKMVERTNLMSGTKYMEAEDTPLCCSPASETYWSS